jgi:UDP-N-acetylmuramoylalanine--D-glutamate ligase
VSLFAGERVVVVGLGTSGLAAARALVEEGASVRVSEARPLRALDADAAAAVDAMGVEVGAGGHRRDHLDRATLVVASPGVPEHAPILAWARDRGIVVWSELELGARLCRVPYVGVTGTNGKSTTTEMVAAAMREAGLSAVACGNIGRPFSTEAREAHDALAVEASSFQLRYHETFHPRVSVLLNLSADHLDWHGSMREYAAAKARIFELQAAGDTHVGNAGDVEAAAISRSAPCHLVWYRLDAPARGEVGFVDGEIVARLSGGDGISLGRPAAAGTGFQADATAAAAAALSFGLHPTAVSRGIGSVGPLPHRGQDVASIASVRFVDDSKATNPHAALAALEGLDHAVLIAGGLSKGVDLGPLAAAASRLDGVVAIGEAASQVAEVFEGSVTVRKAGSMEEAVRTAFDLATAGGVVILAPACASQDMFRDYGERGERFAAAAAALAEDRARG